MDNIEVNVQNNKVDIKELVKGNRPELNAFGGAALGSKYFKAEARVGILNFEEMKHSVEKNGNIDFILNRNPQRIVIKDFDITGINLKNDANGGAVLVLNEGGDGEVRIPYGMHNNKPAFSKVTDDALRKALHGDPSVIFSDAEKVVDQANALNVAEKTRLKKLVEDINKQIQTIDNAIISNKKKADEYFKEKIRKAETEESDAVIIAPTNSALPVGTTVQINVE